MLLILVGAAKPSLMAIWQAEACSALRIKLGIKLKTGKYADTARKPPPMAAFMVDCRHEGALESAHKSLFERKHLTTI